MTESEQRLNELRKKLITKTELSESPVSIVWNDNCSIIFLPSGQIVQKIDLFVFPAEEPSLDNIVEIYVHSKDDYLVALERAQQEFHDNYLANSRDKIITELIDLFEKRLLILETHA